MAQPSWGQSEPGQAGDELGFQSQVQAETEELEGCEPESELAPKQRLTRASEHFNRGRELYEQGSYQQSIREFAAAYCHAPDPAPLKNIAQAYERLIQYEKAVVYLKRYILELPLERKQERDRTGFRLKVLERQPASIRVATLPAGAEVTLENEAGPVAKRRANEKPIMVQRGT
ncbi:MAG: hypothetical protein KJO07_09030, partial [Deltaproteobacteria bacterium]|nr:hypothetical protein [Deltaproteobacteria bacterium]